MSGARRFFSADTEVLAVMEAAAQFGLAPAELLYRPVEKKHGFLRRPKVVIEVDPANPRREAGTVGPPAERGPAPAAPPPSRAGEAGGREPARNVGATESARSPRWRDDAAVLPDRGDGDAAPAQLEAFEGPLTGVDGAIAATAAVAALAGLRVRVAAEVVAAEEGDEVRVEVEGAGRQALLARQGELLRTCEHLARRMVRDLPSGGLTLDSGGFREERTRTLRRRAAAAAEEVRRSGEPVQFEPLPAADRRILHLAVEAEAGVVSQSEGEGDRRSVRIVPATASGGAGSTGG